MNLSTSFLKIMIIAIVIITITIILLSTTVFEQETNILHTRVQIHIHSFIRSFVHPLSVYM